MVSESETSIKLPVIDISEPLLALQQHPSSLSSLAEACREWGFFHITNHGISKDLYNNILSFSKQLFGLPSETKNKVGPSSGIKTYTPPFIASPFFESLRVSGPDFISSAQSSTLVLFDQHDSKFSEMLQEYGNKLTDLSKKIVKIILMSLGEGYEKKFYDSEFKNCHGYLRINHYTPPKNLEEETEVEVEGLGKHTDMSCITILYQDENGGLQVKSKGGGEWLDIRPCEGTLVVNIGDVLQAWSNGRLRSSEHRVVLRELVVSRLSLAFFWCFEDEKVVLAPEEVVVDDDGEEVIRVYRPFVCLDYLRFRESNIETGKFDEIVGLTVEDFAGIQGKGKRK